MNASSIHSLKYKETTMSQIVHTTTAARISGYCSFSKKSMDGERICKFTIQQYNYLLDLLRITHLPDEMIEYILNLSVYSKLNIGKWGLEPYTNFINQKTKSGRSIINPIRFSQQTFVSGTYDRYDTQYYNGISYDKYEYQGPTNKLEAPINYDYGVEDAEEFLSDDEDEPMGDGSDTEFEPDEETVSEGEFTDDEDDFE